MTDEINQQDIVEMAREKAEQEGANVALDILYKVESSEEAWDLLNDEILRTEARVSWDAIDRARLTGFIRQIGGLAIDMRFDEGDLEGLLPEPEAGQLN